MSIEYWVNKMEAEIIPMTFIRESNRIEGLTHEPTPDEIKEHERFMALDEITISEIERFVAVYEPGAKLRDKKGMIVSIGAHLFPASGENLMWNLENLLDQMKEMDSYQVHCEYVNIHPFTDCNGRSGRALWLWHMKKAGADVSLGFLHTFYYQALEGRRRGDIHKHDHE